MSGITKTFFNASPGKQPLFDNDVFNPLTTDEGNNIMYLNFSTNLTLKKKRHMYYFPMYFEKLTLDGSKTLIQHQISKSWWQMVNLNAPLEPSSSNSR